MPKLWTFGDSFTAGHGMNGEIPEYQHADKEYKWTKLLANELDFELKDYSQNGAPNERILTNLIHNLENFTKDDIVIIQSSTISRYEFPFYHKKKETKEVTDGFIWFLNELDSAWYTYDKIKDEYETYDGDVISKLEYDASKDFVKYMLSSTYYYRRSVINLLNIAKYLHNLNIVKNVIFWNLESIRIDSVPNKQPLVFNLFDDYSMITQFSLYDSSHTGIDTFDYGWLSIFRRLKLTIWDDSEKSIYDFHLSKKGHHWFANIMLNRLNINKKIKPENII